MTAAFTLLPTTTAQDGSDELVVVGEYVITVAKPGTDDDAAVSENLYLSNEGDAPFEGSLTFDIDPDATFTGAFIADALGTPLGGDAGGFRPEHFTVVEGSDYDRYTLDLGAVNVSFAPDSTHRFMLGYSLPGGDDRFDRRLDREISNLELGVWVPNGLVPVGVDHDFVNLPGTQQYRLEGTGGASIAAGTAIAFTLEPTPVPATPLTVRVSASGTDPIELTARASGGIGPYSYTWFRDGVELPEHAGAASITVDASDGKSHTYRAEVTDAAQPTGKAEQSYALRVASATAPQPVDPAGSGDNAWIFGAVGLLVGALLLYALATLGVVGGPKPSQTRPSLSTSGASVSAESKEMLALRKRTNMAALKELELAKKKGEVAEGLYLPLKEELKGATVRVMREIEKREKETV